MDVWAIVLSTLSSASGVIVAIVAVINLADRKAHDKRRSNARRRQRRLPMRKR